MAMGDLVYMEKSASQARKGLEYSYTAESYIFPGCSGDRCTSIPSTSANVAPTTSSGKRGRVDGRWYNPIDKMFH